MTEIIFDRKRAFFVFILVAIAGILYFSSVSENTILSPEKGFPKVETVVSHSSSVSKLTTLPSTKESAKVEIDVVSKVLPVPKLISVSSTEEPHELDIAQVPYTSTVPKPTTQPSKKPPPKIENGEHHHNDVYGFISDVPDDIVGFNYINTNSDSRFSSRSSKCVVPNWNKLRTDVIPNSEIHEKWMKAGISKKDFLYHKTPSPFAAFVYEHHIAVTLTSENQFGKTMICRYFDCNMVEIMDPFESKVFPESTVFCGRRPGAEYISITFNVTDKPEPPVHIQKRFEYVTQHFFTVCLATLYGTEPKFIQIVDFIEYYKLQGATKIHIYVRNVTHYDRRLLDDYARTGEIEVIVVHDNWWRDDPFWHMAQINDCHFRSINFAKWTAFIDIDERIEMKKHVKTIAEFLETIEDPNIVNLHFLVQWVLKPELSPEKYENDNQLIDHMIFRRFTNTSAVGGKHDQPKTIIRPDMIGAMTIHGPVAVYEGFIRTMVKPEVAVVRHYRNMFGGKDDGAGVALSHGPFKTTEVEPWIKENLTKAIIDRVNYVYNVHDNFTCSEMNYIYQLHGWVADCYRKIMAEEEKQKKIKKRKTRKPGKKHPG